MQQSAQTLSAILDLGEAMLEAGAEVSRVETAISLLARAYGFTRVNAYTTMYSIVVSADDPAGDILTQTRRISRLGNDLHRLEQLNALSRRLCAHPAPAEEMLAAVRDIHDGPRYPRWLQFCLDLVIPLTMSLFFGGRLPDALASSACGAVLWHVERLGNWLEIKSLAHCFFCSLAVGLCATALVWLFPALQLSKVIIGNIMLLISGLALTVSLRDMINGDMITGLLGFSSAVLRAVLIAIGTARAPILLGGMPL